MESPALTGAATTLLSPGERGFLSCHLNRLQRFSTLLATFGPGVVPDRISLRRACIEDLGLSAEQVSAALKLYSTTDLSDFEIYLAVTS